MLKFDWSICNNSRYSMVLLGVSNYVVAMEQKIRGQKRMAE